MIIDIHVHLSGFSESKGCFMSSAQRRTLTMRFLKRKFGIRGEPGDEEMDRRYVEVLQSTLDGAPEVDAMVVLAMDGIYDGQGKLDWQRTHFVVGNDYLFEVSKERPGFLPGASINPQRRDALDELDRCAGRGAVLIKWIPNSQAFDPADRRYRPFYRKLAALKLPLLTHTGYEHTIPVTDQTLGDPARYRPALDEGATVIAAHVASMGYRPTMAYYRTLAEMMGQYPNLYGDQAALLSPISRHYLLDLLKHPDLMARTLHGTDFPVPFSPWIFVDKLGVKTVRRLSGVKNQLTRDILTKRALGVPEGVFLKGAALLKELGKLS